MLNPLSSTGETPWRMEQERGREEPHETQQDKETRWAAQRARRDTDQQALQATRQRKTVRTWLLVGARVISVAVMVVGVLRYICDGGMFPLAILRGGSRLFAPIAPGRDDQKRVTAILLGGRYSCPAMETSQAGSLPARPTGLTARCTRLGFVDG